MNVIPTIRYLWLTCQHKYFVLCAGLWTRAPLWRLLIHDWTKFTLSEAPHYGRQFFGAKDDPEGFARAWLHHQNHNPHHWEYWISRSGHIHSGHIHGGMAMCMPAWAVREMVADWLGASRTYTGQWPRDLEQWQWLRDKLPSIMPRLHPRTRKDVLDVLWHAFGRQTLTGWLADVTMEVMADGDLSDLDAAMRRLEREDAE